MARILGIGGVFFKSDDPQNLNQWYRQHLGIQTSGSDGAIFPWRRDDDPDRKEMTVWSVFSSSTNYFEPSPSSFMINYIVDDLDSILDELRAAGVTVDGKRETGEFGKFAWIADPDGNRIELWEPLRAPAQN